MLIVQPGIRCSIRLRQKAFARALPAPVNGVAINYATLQPAATVDLYQGTSSPAAEGLTIRRGISKGDEFAGCRNSRDCKVLRKGTARRLLKDSLLAEVSKGHDFRGC